jgi:hypothetical protein
MYKLGEEKTVIRVGYHEVEKVITEEYGFRWFEIPYNEEMGNDVTMEVHVDGHVDDYERKYIKDRRGQYMTRTYMNDLARRGLIKKGVYMIDISW